MILFPLSTTPSTIIAVCQHDLAYSEVIIIMPDH